MEEVDIAIIGAGPAGLTAALYAARARAKTLVFEIGIPGGQIATTDWVENYPGFPEGSSGSQLGELMKTQAERFGAEIRLFGEVASLKPHDIDLVLETDEGDVLAKAVILATGAVPRRLGVPGEADYSGRGVSWCATCDGALYKGKTVAVVGGGDAAVEEALFLTKFASKVHLVHRRDELRATKCIQERCFANEKIQMQWSRVVRQIEGDGSRVVALDLASTKDEPDERLPVDGVFIYVGVDPKNELVKDLVSLSDDGFVKIDHAGMTDWPGLYAAGDITDYPLKQVVTAAGQGATAAFEAVKYIDERLCTI